MTENQSNQQLTSGIIRPASRTIYTDGGAHNNDTDPKYGMGSFAWLEPVDISQGYVDVYGQYVSGTTNNIMEMQAVINGIATSIERGYDKVHIISDSGYLVDGFTNPAYMQRWIKKGWRLSTGDPVKNIKLWQELQRLSWCSTMTFEHIRGHKKDKSEIHAFWNDICDKACTYIIENLPTENLRYNMRYDFNTKKFEITKVEVII